MVFIIIYITHKNAKQAKKVVSHLLKKKLITCANFLPIKSVYWWKGKITEEPEFVLIAKTLESNFEKVKSEVEKIHSYKVPCIIKILVSSNKKYFDWLKGELE